MQTMPLPPLVKERLLNRESIDIGTKKTNEYRVRQYIKDYFKGLEDVLWALDILPEKQISKLFTNDDVYRFLEIAERAIVTLDFLPLRRADEGTLLAEKSLITNPKESGSPRAFSVSRTATDQDKQRYTTLRKHISRLQTFVQPQPHAIYNDLDKIYFRDLIKTAKRDGYKPVEVAETQGWQYIPNLTPGQVWFRGIRDTLTDLGFQHIEYPSDMEILKEALRSTEGKALMEKFRSMQEQTKDRV